MPRFEHQTTAPFTSFGGRCGDEGSSILPAWHHQWLVSDSLAHIFVNFGRRSLCGMSNINNRMHMHCRRIGRCSVCLSMAKKYGIVNS